jgi:putative PIN family toxin of toxin-antitoxin system
VIRATLDVNVLVSGFATGAGTPSQLIDQWIRRQFTLVVSEHVLTRLALVWDRPYWSARYQPKEAQRALRLLRNRATIVEPDLTIRRVAEDEEDDLVIATAVAGRVEILVTGDKFPQGLGFVQGITILSPRQFLDLLEAESPHPR